jgi:diacylglycerol kinase family enzyme
MTVTPTRAARFGPTRRRIAAPVPGGRGQRPNIFLNNAGVGMYPTILEQREDIYRRFGRSRIAAHWSVATTFLRFYRLLSIKVTVDGQDIRKRTPLAFIARSR